MLFYMFLFYSGNEKQISRDLRDRQAFHQPTTLALVAATTVGAGVTLLPQT